MERLGCSDTNHLQKNSSPTLAAPRLTPRGNTVPKLPLVFLLLAALLTIFFGVRYLRTKEFMPYHAVVAGKSWSELELGVQTIILGMLKIIGGGFTTYGLALLWLLLPLNRGESWALWAVLTITATAIVPTLYVTVMLRRFEPKAKTPVVPTVIALALVLAGVSISFLT